MKTPPFVNTHTRVKPGTVTQDNQVITLTLKEVSARCGVSADYLLELIEYGVLDNEIIAPHSAPAELQLDAVSLFKIQRLVRLKQDLSLNTSGAVLAVDLLEEIDRLHAHISHLEALIDTLIPDE